MSSTAGVEGGGAVLDLGASPGDGDCEATGDLSERVDSAQQPESEESFGLSFPLGDELANKKALPAKRKAGVGGGGVNTGGKPAGGTRGRQWTVNETMALAMAYQALEERGQIDSVDQEAHIQVYYATKARQMNSRRTVALPQVA